MSDSSIFLKHFKPKHLLKYYIVIQFIFITVGQIKGQNTFSKAIDLDNQIDEAVAIRKLDDGYLILVGSYCFSNSLPCYSYIKTDFEGNVIWKKQIMNFPRSIKPQDGNGNHGIATNPNMHDLFFTGVKYNENTGSDYFLMRVNQDGDSLWLKTYGGSRSDLASDVFFNSDSTILLFGERYVGQNDERVSIMQFDLNGIMQWEKLYGKINTKVAVQDIIQLKNGDLLFTYLYCEVGVNCLIGDDKQLIMTKVDSKGNEIWTKEIYTYTEFWSFSNLLELDTLNYVVSFYKNNFQSGFFYTAILLWVDSVGNIQKELSFPRENQNAINDLILTSSGEIVGTGFIDKLELGIAGWVFAVTQNGENLWNREILDYNSTEKLMKFNALEEAENSGIILTGTIYNTIPNSQEYTQDIWLVKLDNEGCLEPNCSELEIITAEEHGLQSNSELKIYPNPANNILYINAQGFSNFYMLKLWNVYGDLVLNDRMNADMYSMDISFLNAGIYLLQIWDSKNRFLIYKIVSIVD